MKAKFAFSMAILMLMLSMLATSNSFAAITFSQLSSYDSAIHYNTLTTYPDDYDAGAKPDPVTLGAVARGKAEVPIMKVQVVGEAGGSFLDMLTVVYSGTRLPDIGTYASIYETTYTLFGNLITATLINERSISSGEVTLLVGHSIAEGAVKTYVIALDITSGAGSNKVDLRVKTVNGSDGGSPTGYIEDGGVVDVGNIGVVHTPNPDGYAHIDASPPAITGTPTYNLGTKVLTLQFSDGGARDVNGNPINVPNPRVNVIDKSDGNTVWKVDLSKIQIRALDDSPSVALSGASFLYPDDTNGTATIPDKDADEGRADQAAGNYGVVKIKLTPAQDVFVQIELLQAGEGAEIYINGALTDYQFGNLIGEHIRALYDTGSPSPVANFTASNPTDTTIDLTWTNPPDEDFAGALIVRSIVRSQDFITWRPTTGVSYTIDQVVAEGVTVHYLDADDHSTKPFTDTGLSPSTTYYYRAFAYDFFLNYSTGVEDSETALLVILSSLTATAKDDGVILKWRTEAEVNNLGFNVYRSDKKDGKYTKVNASLIKGAGTDGTSHDYSFTDETVVKGFTYYYYIEDVDFSGKTNKSHIIEATTGKPIIKPPTPIKPLKFALLQNYPNPFNPDTWLPYELAKDAIVTIHIYNVKGQLVRQLNIGKQEAGSYIDKEKATYWDGRDGLGQAVSSGIYFYMLKAGDFQATKRMVIVK